MLKVLLVVAMTLPLLAADEGCGKTLLDEKSPAALLAAMDNDLDRIEQGKDACGSFTDYFAMNAWYAIKAGAPRKSINPRIERLLALAKKGVYLSSYEKGLAKDGGTAAIKDYMERTIKDAVSDVVKDAPRIPEKVLAQLVAMKSGKQVKCYSTFGCGTGVYRLTEGREVPFFWYSYSNSDGWEQIALTTKIYEYDRRSIQGLRDQLGRRGIYDSWSSNDFTWVGLSNDLWVKDDLKDRYVHVTKWTSLPGGGKLGEYSYHRAELTRDYLGRLTAATGGHLRFTVVD